MSKRVWQIQGYNSTKKIFDARFPTPTFSDKQIQALLMALVAKAGLNFDEITGAYASKRSKKANNLLAVRKDHRYPSYTCGDNPHFAARVVDDDG